MYHKMAKDVFERNNWVGLPGGGIFHYTQCLVETGRHGKRPDIYLINDDTQETLIVEILYTHRTDNDTQNVYHRKGERVLQIDVSDYAKMHSNLDAYELFVLRDAPREYLVPIPQAEKVLASPENIPTLQPPLVEEPSDDWNPLGHLLTWIKDQGTELFIIGLGLVALALYRIWRRRNIKSVSIRSR